MAKFVVATVNTECMEIDIKTYNTYEDAYTAMKAEVEEVVNGLGPGLVTGSDVYEDSAWVVSIDYEYSWKLAEVSGE